MNMSKVTSISILQKRFISYKAVRSWYAGLTRPKKNNPPFRHIIQIGDPNLRVPADTLPVEEIASLEVQFLIKRLKYVFEKYRCCGLSANQIGIPLKIFIMEFNKKHAGSYSEAEFKNKEMALINQKIVINPEIKVLDYQKIVYPESCESIKGFYADVPRYRAVRLTGFDQSGKELSLDTRGWIARIIQHEVDHLNGIVYTDIMDRKTLTCSCWNVINERSGKVELPYGE